MKDVIILEKTREKKKLSKGLADTTATAEVARVSNSVDFAGGYGWAMSKAHIETAKKLGLTGVRNYWRRAGQVEMELDWLHNWIGALVIFVRHSQRMYDNKKEG